MFSEKADGFEIEREDLLVQHFSDGHGRGLPLAAWLLMFMECLRHGIAPFILGDKYMIRLL